MHVIEKRAEGNAKASAHLVLSFEARCKSRLRTRLLSGEEVGLFMERGTVLRGGDKLAANDGTVIEVVAAPEMLMEAQTDDPLLLAKAAYHLGNRHVPVEIGRGWLAYEHDHVLDGLVADLGLAVEVRVAPFDPEAGGYRHGGEATHGHTHEHGHGHDH